MAHTVAWCLSVVEPLVKSISLVLFDREFYSNELMLTLSKTKYPYLIFVPKILKFERNLLKWRKMKRKMSSKSSNLI